MRQWQGENQLYSTPNDPSPSFKVIWITGGRASCMIDAASYAIDRPAVCVIAAHSSYCLEAYAGSTGLFISFSRDFIVLPSETADQYLYLDSMAALAGVSIIEEKATLGEMGEIMMYMQREYGQYYMLRSDILNSWLKIFLAFLKRACQKAGASTNLSRPVQLVRRFFELLDIGFLDKKRVSDYATDLLVVAPYLNEMVKRHTGYPASYHIRQRILLEAKRLAIHSTYSQKEVAYHLGFADPGHFSKFFKNYTGLPFTDFRRQRMLRM
jgi:AraC family transcriptional regulator, transcriptional activator of pobA